MRQSSQEIYASNFVNLSMDFHSEEQIIVESRLRLDLCEFPVTIKMPIFHLEKFSSFSQEGD